MLTAGGGGGVCGGGVCVCVCLCGGGGVVLKQYVIPAALNMITGGNQICTRYATPTSSDYLIRYQH